MRRVPSRTYVQHACFQAQCPHGAMSAIESAKTVTIRSDCYIIARAGVARSIAIRSLLTPPGLALNQPVVRVPGASRWTATAVPYALHDPLSKRRKDTLN